MPSMSLYQQYIAKSKYARYLDKEQRREHWPETVARYFDFMTEHLAEKCSYALTPELRSELETAVLNLEVMPSMRLMMTAGEAAKRQNLCAFNCSYIAIDHQKSFDELMYLLMCGCGVGFGVEQQSVSCLDDVPDKLFESDTTIVVSDSKEGFAKALRQLVALLFSGEIPKWDLSKLRPAGARLKTFGGRSSGPKVLEKLFDFFIKTFKQAVGRKLTSLECHDLCCKIAEVVVVGGVRRSALISLSDLNDLNLRKAKVGDWWNANSHRSLANNSAVYKGKPDPGVFMEEWASLYHSGSGERGFFNRKAADMQAVRTGRRKPYIAYGLNPCAEVVMRSLGLCNLTESVIRPGDSREDLLRKVRIASILGTFQASLTDFPYVRKAWVNNAKEERLLGVSLTGIMDNKLTQAPSEDLLKDLRDQIIATNIEFSSILGIEPSVATTVVKPSGTVSQLVNCSSGIHPAHAPYYIRRVRSDNKDPITEFLKTYNIPSEPCAARPESTTVFEFPVKAPEYSIFRKDISAIEHLELWLKYKMNYTEHNPSITVSVKESEWVSVGAWVYEHFDEVLGISFLPFDGGTYEQMPYQEITKEKYEELAAAMPTSIDWDSLIEYDDKTEGVQNLACSGGSCEI